VSLQPIDRLLGWPAWCAAPANDNAAGDRTWIDAVRAWIVDPLARISPALAGARAAVEPRELEDGWSR